MDITIVIVNYRVKYFLEQTLRSVMEATQGLRAEVIVIDNASGDDSIAFSRERFPEVTFIENKDNVGFARANNQGIMMARGKYTLILNPDTIVTEKCIKGSIAHMEDNEHCGAIGLRMVDGNGRFLPESKRAFPTPWVAFCKIFGLSKLFPRSPHFAKYHLRYLSDREKHVVDILSGAYMLCRTSMLQSIGGLDEDFFMYGEDIDLSFRLNRDGYQNWFLPLDMIHYKGESTKKGTMQYVRIFYEAMLIFYRKHFPRYSAVAYPIIKAGVYVRAGIAMLNRLIINPFRKKEDKRLNQPWVIISNDAKQAAAMTGINRYSEQLPAQGKSQVLLDDGCMTYGQIVDYISSHSRKGLEYHILARRHGRMISPKM
ncbi:glycosyltransferase family 2 protein [Sodaliphilus sp.]|uniref:glycosyltransferase family 2 protein n=1 Tax=Sodaliphilus sp. TaxID=2815818 RepID=UPI003890E227